MHDEKVRDYICNAGQLFYRMKLPREFVDVNDPDWAPDVGLSELLYHYTSAKGFESIAKSTLKDEPHSPVRNLYASHHECLNDQNEIRFGFCIVDKVIDELRSEMPPEVVQNLTAKINGLKGIPAYLACFSTKYDSLAQWRAYANNAAGFCIGFRIQPHQQGGYHGIHSFRCVFSCLYGKEAVRTPLMASLRRKLARQKDLDGKFPNQAMLFAAELAMVAWRYAHRAKHEHFKEEDEWRCVEYAAMKGPGYRFVERGFVPFIEMPLAIEKVWIGPRIGPTKEIAVEAVQTLLSGAVPPDNIQFWSSPYRP